MSAAAVFLNALMCTTPGHTTCMPPQFVWMAPKYLSMQNRASQCEERAKALNEQRKDLSMLFRCDPEKGA